MAENRGEAPFSYALYCILEPQGKAANIRKESGVSQLR